MKTGILTLNEGSVFKNASLWSHDPSMMWDPVTEKYYSYSTDVYQPEDGLTVKNRNSGQKLKRFDSVLNMKELRFPKRPSKKEETTESIHRL